MFYRPLTAIDSLPVMVGYWSDSLERAIESPLVKFAQTHPTTQCSLEAMFVNSPAGSPTVGTQPV